MHALACKSLCVVVFYEEVKLYSCGKFEGFKCNRRMFFSILFSFIIAVYNEGKAQQLDN